MLHLELWTSIAVQLLLIITFSGEMLVKTAIWITW